MNYGRMYRKYPILCYHGYYQRRTGCFAAANRTLYVDTAGDMHACPYCRNKSGSALAGGLDGAIEQLATAGCHKFETSIF
jgi:hypothetical protein